ncbi:MAG TPA: GMC family oxidoreductase [Kofleriaceae bacterium]|nr:GMC family oxidoreductase [Kofleriaceae bacterium]
MTPSSADVLIIGSGVAAAAIAERLLRHDARASILIVEAGGKVKLKDFGLWQNYLVTGKLPYDPYKDFNYPDRDHPGENASTGGTQIPLAGARVMTYGGSTIHWGGWSFRLKPEDFRLYSQTGESIDWPISYSDLEPYYSAAEHYIGVSGDSSDPTVPRNRAYPFPAFPFTLEDQPIANAMKACGIPYSHLPIARHGMTQTESRHAPCQTTGTCKYCPFGARYAAGNFLDDMTEWGNFPNLHLRVNTIVEHILVDAKRTAIGIQVVTRGSDVREVLTGKTIIVAGGTIESSKLLLRSRSSGWQQGIGNDADLVGRNFITHPYFIFTGAIAENPLRLQTEMDFPTLCSRHFDSEAEQKAGKFILVNPPGVPSSLSLVQQMQNGVRRPKLDAAITGSNQIQLHGMLEVFSRFNNRVSNLDRRNHLGMYETQVDYTQDSTFDSRMAEIQGHVAAIFDKAGASLVGKPSVSWRADHAACTCRMSRDDAQGVVDPDLKIHGMDNLYVCSNAVFDSTGAVNPTLTLTALAIRLADHLIHGGAAPLAAGGPP